MIDLFRYDGMMIHQSSCQAVNLTYLDSDGEREEIHLTDENCERFEEHTRGFYKIVYKPFRERFLVKQTVLWEPTILGEIEPK